MRTTTLAEPHPLPERQRWTAYFQDHLRDRLTWAIVYARDAVTQRRPAALKERWNSLLALLHQARPRADLAPLSVELIAALHPWPARWGYWEIWEEEIHFALQVAEREGKSAQQAEFAGYLAQLLFNMGRLEPALATSQRAMTLARSTGQAHLLAVAGSAVLESLVRLGRFDQALNVIRALAQDIQRAPRGQFGTIASIQLDISSIKPLWRQGYLPEALQKANRAIASLQNLAEADVHLLARAHAARADVFIYTGDYAAAAHDLGRAAELFGDAGDLLAQATVQGDLGEVYRKMSRFAEAEQAILQRITLAEQLNAREQLGRAIDGLIGVYLSQGQLDRARIYCERLVELARYSGDQLGLFQARENLGAIRLYRGECAAALPELEMCQSFFLAQAKDYVTTTTIDQSCCYAGLGQLERARQLAELVLREARQNNMPISELMALRCLALCQPAPQQAESLRQALALARKHQRRLDEAGCLLSLAELAQDEQERQSLWEQGRHILQEIGATSWLENHLPLYLPRVPIIG